MKYINIDLKAFRERLLTPVEAGAVEPMIPTIQDENPQQEQEVEQLRQQSDESLPTIGLGLERIPLVSADPFGQEEQGQSFEGSEPQGQIPQMEAGGIVGNPPIYVDSRNDPRLKSYQDSLKLYNSYIEDVKGLKFSHFEEPVIREEAVATGKLINGMPEYVTKKVNSLYIFDDDSIKPIGWDYRFKNIRNEDFLLDGEIRSNLEHSQIVGLPKYKKPQQPVKVKPDPAIVSRQQQLIDAGYDIGAADGIWGSKSKKAWEQMQSGNQPTTNFEQRIQNPDLTIQNQDGSVSTHRMMSFENDGRFYAAPTIVERDGQLVELTPDEAIEFAFTNNEYREFDTEEAAQRYAQGDYKKRTPLQNMQPDSSTTTRNTQPSGKDFYSIATNPKGEIIFNVGQVGKMKAMTVKEFNEFKNTPEFSKYKELNPKADLYRQLQDPTAGYLKEVEQFQSGGEPLPFLINPSTGRTGQPTSQPYIDERYLQSLMDAPDDGMNPTVTRSGKGVPTNKQAQEIEMLNQYKQNLPHLKNADLATVKKHYEMNKQVQQNAPANISQQYRTPQIIERDAEAVRRMQTEKLGVMDLPLTILGNPLGAVGEALEGAGFKNQPFGNYEQERSRVMQNRYNPYQTGEQRFNNTLGIAGEFGTNAALNVGLTGALMPNASAGRILGESLLPFGSVDDLARGAGKVGNKLTSSVDDVGKGLDYNFNNSFLADQDKESLSELRNTFKKHKENILSKFKKEKDYSKTVEDANSWSKEWLNDPERVKLIDAAEKSYQKKIDEYIEQRIKNGEDVMFLKNPFSSLKGNIEGAKFNSKIGSLNPDKSKTTLGTSGYDVNKKTARRQNIVFLENIKEYVNTDFKHLSKKERQNKINELVEHVTIHEGNHGLTDGNVLLPKEWQKDMVKIFGKDVSIPSRNPNTNKFDTTKDYLQNPTEIYARIMEMRKFFGINPKDKITPKQAFEMCKKIASGETPINKEFGQLVQDPKKLASIMNYLPASVTAAIGTGAVLGTGAALNRNQEQQQFQQGGLVFDNELFNYLPVKTKK